MEYSVRIFKVILISKQDIESSSPYRRDPHNAAAVLAGRTFHSVFDADSEKASNSGRFPPPSAVTVSATMRLSV